MDEPLMPGRGGSRTETVLVGVLVAGALLVVSGFLFDLPWGFGGVQLSIIAAPVMLSVVALTVVLRGADSRRRGRRR